MLGNVTVAIGSDTSSDWLPNWMYRKQHLILGSSAGLQTNYQMQLTVINGTGLDNGDTVYVDNKCQLNFGDIRFCNEEGDLLDYWIETVYPGINATFWIEIDTIPAAPDSAVIYLYYGNADVVTTSDGDATFLFWDDFETNLDKWNMDISTALPQLSASHPYEGLQGVEIQPDISRLDHYTDVTTGTAIRVWFYDSMSENVEAAILASKYGYAAAIGVMEQIRSTHYIYRITDNFYDSNVPRAVGWHLFEITQYDSVKQFYIDGIRQAHSDNSDIDLIKVGSGWDTNSAHEYFDVLIQRTYCDPEPAHNLWGLEEIGVPTMLSLALSSSTAYLGFQVDISGSLSQNGSGVMGASILLSYSVTNGDSWNDITQVHTGRDGSYSATWAPSATGSFLIQAAWPGNATHPYNRETLQLAVLPFEEQTVFSVTSNSTISALAFNSTSYILAFSASGPDNITGSTTVRIAKTLIPAIENVYVLVDGIEIEYHAVSQHDAWQLEFTYQHSTHQITIQLGSEVPFYTTPTGLIIILGGIAMSAFVVYAIYRRRCQASI
jgi:hypothetical protein